MEDAPKAPAQENEKKPNLKRKRLEPQPEVNSKDETGDSPLCCRESASNLSPPKPKRMKVEQKEDHKQYAFGPALKYVDILPSFPTIESLLSAAFDDAEKVYYTNIGWMIDNERRYFPDPNALAYSQPELNPFMRAILIEWLSEVSEELGLHRETFMLALNYIDRFLSVGPIVPKSQFQLVGITALWIATKNEELNIRKRPQLECFTDFTDNIYTPQEVHKMEDVMLHFLGWKLRPVTPNVWLQTYMQFDYDLITKSCNTTYNFAQFYSTLMEDDFTVLIRQYYLENKFPKKLFLRVMQTIEKSCLDYASLQFLPSVLVASAFAFLYLGCKNPKTCPPELPLRLNKITGYSMEQLSSCLTWLQEKGYFDIQPPHPHNIADEELPEDFHNKQYCVPLQTHSL